MRHAYLDNNATTRVAGEVIAEMLPYFTTYWGNPSSMYEFGGKLKKHIDNSRAKIAELIGAQYPSEIVFTASGTESDNMAIQGVLATKPDKKHIITTSVEHPAVLTQVNALKRKGYEVSELKVNKSGMIDLEELKASIRDDTAIISIMWANNETGVIFPVKEAAQIASEYGVSFHTDAVQATGKIPINVKDLPIDLLSFSGHKIHAPKGIGVLYIKRGTRIRPFVIGGHQERNRRGGTENVPYIMGLGKAAELAILNLEKETNYVQVLKDRLESFILNNIPHTHLNGAGSPRLPNTLNIGFDFIEGEAILLTLDKHGIAASSGSACTSGSLNPSHVLRAMNVPFTNIHGSVRFSLSLYNPVEDIEYVEQVLPGIIEELRDISPFKSMDQVINFAKH